MSSPTGLLKVDDMNFNIVVEPENGHYIAQVVGSPFLRAEGNDSASATKALLASLRLRRKQGTLFPAVLEPENEPDTSQSSVPRPVFYDFNPKSFHDLAGVFKDDPDLMEICEEAYRLRRAERDREWPE